MPKKFSPQLEKLLADGQKYGWGYPERVLAANLLAAEGTQDEQWALRKQTAFVKEEDMLSAENVASLARVLNAGVTFSSAPLPTHTPIMAAAPTERISKKRQTFERDGGKSILAFNESLGRWVKIPKPGTPAAKAASVMEDTGPIVEPTKELLQAAITTARQGQLNSDSADYISQFERLPFEQQGERLKSILGELPMREGMPIRSRIEHLKAVLVHTAQEETQNFAAIVAKRVKQGGTKGEAIQWAVHNYPKQYEQYRKTGGNL